MDYKNAIKENFLKCKDILNTTLQEANFNNQQSLSKFIDDFYEDFFSKDDIRKELTKSQGFILDATLDVVRKTSLIHEVYSSTHNGTMASRWMPFVGGIMLGLAIGMSFVNWVVAMIMLLIFILLSVLVGKSKCDYKSTKFVVDTEKIIDSIEQNINSIDHLLEVYSVQINNIKMTLSK